MAAIDLERGLEHSGRAWGKERPELMDNFDSEMQEWEDQLQDIQRKIEELYNGVQARRGANDATADEQKNGGEREWGPAHRGESHPAAVPGPRRYGDGCKHSDPVSHQRDCGCCRAASGIGDLLQGYLGQEHQMSRKNNGARHVRFSDTIKVSAATERRTASGEERLGQETLAGSSEQTENRKNQVSHPRSSPNKENTGAKPPLGQRDAASAPPRSQPPIARAESPAPDRKALGPAALGDRKCGSPSVLRKFGAMLQENEGKMLTESGVVAHQVAAPEPKSPTPGCQRRAPGACKARARAPVQKCQADAAAPTAETEARGGQDQGSAPDPGRQNHKDHRGAYGGSKGSHWGPQQPQRRSQVAGSPKVRPRANSGADSDGQRARKPASHHAEPKTDHVASSGGQKIHRGGLAGQESAGCGRVRDEGLIELLDMLEIQHEYGSSARAGHTAHRRDPQQVNPAQLPPANPNGSFSRPARPANQRPPSRWAGRAPSAVIAAPPGPTYCPPSPRTRPPSPMARTQSPALRRRPLMSYSLQPETAIM